MPLFPLSKQVLLMAEGLALLLLLLHCVRLVEFVFSRPPPPSSSPPPSLPLLLLLLLPLLLLLLQLLPGFWR